MQFTYIGNQSKKDVRLAGSFANGAFVTANSAASFANGAFIKANSSYDSQNTTASFANGAFVTANSAASFANGAFLRANAAYNFANSLTSSLTVSGNVSANYIIANGSGLTNVNAANVSGYVPYANVANTAGIVTTASQPNITSVGTLTSLTVAGAPITYSVSMSGTTDYVSVTGTNILGSGDYTIETWIKTTDTSFELFASQSGGIALFVSGGVFYVQSAYGSAQVLINSASAITNGNWHHVAVVRSSGTVTLYFDGTSVKTGSDTTDYSAQTASYDIGYGNQSAGRYLNGYLSNFRIVKNTAVYTGNFSVPTSPLTAITNTTLLTFQNSTFIDNSTSARTISVTSGSPTLGYSVTPFPGYGAGGEISASGNVSLSSLLLVQNTTTSISNSSGAIVVTGGVGIKGNIYTGAITVTGSTANGITFADGTTQYTANIGTDSWVRSQANASFDVANSAASFANGAFLRSNSGYTQANTAASFANGAFDRANSSYGVANSGSSFANGAFVTANSAASFANAAFITANSAASFANGAFTTANLKFNSTGGTISGDVNITGNLSITGNTFSTSATQIVANDTLFIMGTGNYSGDVLDIGFAAHYNNGTNAHTGLIRDSGTKEWQLFEEYTPEVGANNNINITDGSFKIATLNANLKSTIITVKNIDLLPYVNNAYDKANSGASFANGAFVVANASFDSQNTTASFANGSFLRANASYIAQNTTASFANAAYAHANAAYNAANTGGSSTDSWARDQANAAFNAANSAGSSTLTGYVDAFTANGVSNNFTLSTTPTDKNITFVAVQGVLQPKASYNIASNILTFDSTPPNTAYIEVTTLVGAGGSGGGSSMTWYISNANTTMVASSGYFVDTSLGQITMTLPASATLGDTIRINDLAGTFSANNLTINRNSHKIQGNTNDLLVNVDQSSFGLIYSNSTYGWKVIEL